MTVQPQNAHKVIIIVGPTASGKTAASLFLAAHLNLEIINADMGQFYAPVAIGTAKPDWQNEQIPHHLFDIVDQPKDINVLTYRSLVLDKTAELTAQGKVPCLVGGSLFYVKSLFFPPLDIPTTGEAQALPRAPELTPWEQLNVIDPLRASKLHPNDLYRINRALDLFKATGKKPSECLPVFNPPFKACIIYIDRPLELLENNINTRTAAMLNDGWIEETEQLMGTAWEPFFKTKKLIGYPEIFEWIEQGKRADRYDLLIATIQQKTRQYALRQNLFWRTCKSQLETAAKAAHQNLVIIQTAEIDQSVLESVCNFIRPC